MSDDDKTIAKTLWSDTLVEILILALQKNSSDTEIRKIIREMRDKGFRKDYVIAKVRKELDEPAVRRVTSLISK